MYSRQVSGDGIILASTSVRIRPNFSEISSGVPTWPANVTGAKHSDCRLTVFKIQNCALSTAFA